MSKKEYIEKLTQMTGISRATIFRHLSGSGVKESTRIKLNDAMEKLGMNRSERSFEIIVSINSHDFDIFKGNSEALAAVLEEASLKGIPVRLMRDASPKGNEGAGVIVLGKHTDELMNEVSSLKKSRVPFVVINRIIPDPAVSYVAAENRDASYDMTRHLIERGAKSIAFWGEQRTMVSRDKLSGVKAAITDAGLSLSDSYFFTDTENVTLEDAINKILALSKRPDAFFTMDDETALLVIRAFLTRGIKVGTDILVSGMNDLDSSKNVVPSISSVHIDFRKFGALAVDILDKLHNNRDISSIKTIVRHELVIRDSTGGSGK